MVKKQQYNEKKYHIVRTVPKRYIKDMIAQIFNKSVFNCFSTDFNENLI
jgi:hypothetical protein